MNRNKVWIYIFFWFVSDGDYLKRTELISVDQVSPGPDLPHPVSRHCTIKISKDEMLLIGGYSLR